MDRQRGYSLIEMMAALLILSIIITMSLAVFIERHERLRQARDIILAHQSLANEAELWRRVPYNELEEELTFRSDTELLNPLGAFETLVEVEKASTGIKHVTLIVRWQDRRKEAKEAKLGLVRVDTGGSNLW